MNVNNYQPLPYSMASFKTHAAFPTGTNVIDRSNAYKTLIRKTDNTAPCILVYDLGWLPAGAYVSFQVDARIVNVTTTGSGAGIAVETRTGVALNTGRKVVNNYTVTSPDWHTLRCDWIVTDGAQYVTLNVWTGTTSIGEYEFRNPRMVVMSDTTAKPFSFNLLRSNGVWSIDLVNYVGNQCIGVSASGNNIQINFPELNIDKLPIVQVTIDGGFTPTSMGFVSAHPHNITKSSFGIRLVNTGGTFLTDVAAGGSARLLVTVHPA